jgi:hypothetical protein
MTVGMDDIEYILVAFHNPVYILFIRISDSACISYYGELKKESAEYVFSQQGKSYFFFFFQIES